MGALQHFTCLYILHIYGYAQTLQRSPYMIYIHLQPKTVDMTKDVAKVHSHVPLQRAAEPLEELG